MRDVFNLWSLSTDKLTKCQSHLSQLTAYSSLPSSGDFVPSCRSDNGHYKTLQCDTSTSICFCVDAFNGYVLSGSKTVGNPNCTKFGMFTCNWSPYVFDLNWKEMSPKSVRDSLAGGKSFQIIFASNFLTCKLGLWNLNLEF